VRGEVALLTLACQVRRLYGRASRLFWRRSACHARGSCM